MQPHPHAATGFAHFMSLSICRLCTHSTRFPFMSRKLHSRTLPDGAVQNVYRTRDRSGWRRIPMLALYSDACRPASICKRHQQHRGCNHEGVQLIQLSSCLLSRKDDASNPSSWPKRML